MRIRIRALVNVHSYLSNTLRADARDILKEIRNRRPQLGERVRGKVPLRARPFGISC